MWYLKSFKELTSQELHMIYKARVAVFVVEQNCPYQEVDDDDLTAWHLFEIKNGRVAAYLRIIPQSGFVKIGRVLVDQRERATGKGRELVARGVEICKEWFMDQPIHAQAQAYLQNFYHSFGFEAVSEIYLEDDIPHIDMILE